MTVATLTERYRGYLLVEVDGEIRVHSPGRGPKLWYIAPDEGEARRWIDEMLDGPEAA